MCSLFDPEFVGSEIIMGNVVLKWKRNTHHIEHGHTFQCRVLGKHNFHKTYTNYCFILNLRSFYICVFLYSLYCSSLLVLLWNFDHRGTTAWLPVFPNNRYLLWKTHCCSLSLRFKMVSYWWLSWLIERDYSLMTYSFHYITFLVCPKEFSVVLGAMASGTSVNAV